VETRTGLGQSQLKKGLISNKERFKQKGVVHTKFGPSERAQSQENLTIKSNLTRDISKNSKCM